MCATGKEICAEDAAVSYEYKLMKARKKDIKEISKLCVDTFLGEGDDWLHISREAQSVARDINNRWGGDLLEFESKRYERLYLKWTYFFSFIGRHR